MYEYRNIGGLWQKEFRKFELKKKKNQIKFGKIASVKSVEQIVLTVISPEPVDSHAIIIQVSQDQTDQQG